MKYSKFLFCFLFLSGISYSSYATSNKRYWVGGGANKNWSNTANWSTTSGTGSGASAPASSDTAYFDMAAGKRCNLDVNINVKRIEFKTGSTDTLDQNGKTITVVTAYVQAAGLFLGSTTSITQSGTFSLSGGIFTSTSGTMTVVGNFTKSGGTFTNNGGLVKFTTSNTITGSTIFAFLEFNAVTSARTFTIASGTTLTSDSTLTLSGSTQITLNTGNIYAKDDITPSSTASNGGGTATITINGATSQTINAASTIGYFFPNVVINKSTGTLHLVGKFAVFGSWTHTAGTLDAGTSLVWFSGSNSISGTDSLYNVTFASSGGATKTISNTLTVNGYLQLYGTANQVVNGGNIHLKGDLKIDNTYALGGGTTIITINGTGTQSIIGSTSVVNTGLPDIVINKSSSDTLRLIGHIRQIGDWTYTPGAGIIDAGTSTVYFYATLTISGSHSLQNVQFYAGTGNHTYTISSGDTLTVKGTLYTGGTNNTTINTGTICAKGNITLNNTGPACGGSGTIVINGTGDQTFTGTTTNGDSRLCNIKINKSNGTLTLSNTISTVGNWTYTAGTIDPGTSLVYFFIQASGTTTVKGTHTLYSVAIGQTSATGNKKFVIRSGNTLTVSHDLSINCGSNTLSIDTGTINVGRNITITNTSSSTGGTATIVANGTGSQTLTGSGIAGSGRLCNFTINKSLGTLSFNNIISFDKAFIYTAGTVSGGGSTCAFYGSGTLDPENSSYSVPFNDFIIAASRTLSGKLNVTQDLTINSSQTLTSGGYDICVGRNWTDNGTFSTSGSGYVTFNGSGGQKISKTIGSSETFKKLAINKSGGADTLKNPVIVTDTLKLTKGFFISTTTNYMRLNDNADKIGGSDSSFVTPVMRKTGNDVFTFPLGAKITVGAVLMPLYHPLAITAPPTNTDVYEAIYYPTGQTSGSAMDSTIEFLSTVEYWNINRITGSGTTVKASLGYNINSDRHDNVSDMVVAGWDGSAWKNLGNSSVTTNGTNGIVFGSIVIPGPNIPVTIGHAVSPNRVYAELKRKPDGGYFQMYDGNLYFKYDEEYNDADSKLLFKIYRISDNKLMYSSNTLKSVYFGDNRYLANILCLGAGIGGGYYMLEVVNEKGEKWYLRFKHTTNLACYCNSCNVN